jgi:hypothetical protein
MILLSSLLGWENFVPKSTIPAQANPLFLTPASITPNSANQLTDQVTSQPKNQLTAQSINQSINQSLDKSVKQSTNQLGNQLVVTVDDTSWEPISNFLKTQKTS